MHPLVRDLYKRAILVGKDYPTGISHVREKWKKALRNSKNCPSCAKNSSLQEDEKCQEEITFAVHRGRLMVKEMVGIIQLKKYRTLKDRYGAGTASGISQAMHDLERKALAAPPGDRPTSSATQR